MTTVVPDQVASGKIFPPGDAEPGTDTKEGETYSIPPLGKPQQEKKFWFQRSGNYDPDAIATLVSTATTPPLFDHGTRIQLPDQFADGPFCPAQCLRCSRDCCAVPAPRRLVSGSNRR